MRSPPPTVTWAEIGIELPDQNGGVFRLDDELSGGPVVLVFFRGHW